MENLWNYEEEDIQEKTAVGGNYVEESGIYECKIEEAELITSNSSKSRAVQIIFKTSDDKTMRVRHWFEKSDGSENKYARIALNKLMFLCKIKSSDMKMKREKDKNLLPAFVGKTIGVIDEVKLTPTEENKVYYEHDVKGYFDIKSKKTADEIKKDLVAETVERWKEIFEKIELKKTVAPVQKETKKEEVDDEFPF